MKALLNLKLRYQRHLSTMLNLPDVATPYCPTNPKPAVRHPGP
jgi:hypothetical protein